MRTCNITQNYVDKHEPWLSILSAAAFAILSTTNRLEGYSPVQLVFVRDTISLIKNPADWELIRQKNQSKINKNNNHENRNQVDHAYKVGDKFMLN